MSCYGILGKVSLENIKVKLCLFQVAFTAFLKRCTYKNFMVLTPTQKVVK